MTPDIPHEKEPPPMSSASADPLLEALKDAHAMEVNVFESLENMIATTRDIEVLDALHEHKRQTHLHARRLEERLQDHGHDASSAKDLGGTIRAAAKGFTDQVRTSKPAKNARDAYAAEHMEIAAYALLERLAERAGDAETAVVARQNRKDEEAMAAWFAERWDRFVDLTLASPTRGG